MASKSGGSFKGAIFTGITLFIIAGLIFGWAKINNIQSISGVYDYFKAVSDKISSCGADHAQWNCNQGDSNNNSNNNSNSDNNSSTNNSSNSGSSGNNNGDSTNSGSSNNNDNSNKGSLDPNNSSKTSLLDALNQIKTDPGSKDAFNEKDWNLWSGSPCSTRDKVLTRDGKNVKIDDPTNFCYIESGSWVSNFDNTTITNVNDANVVNVIPLSYANAHGGSQWDAKTKEKFANDIRFNQVISAKELKKKGDKGPSGYSPSNKNFQCSYTKMWVAEAVNYNLTLTEKDKIVLENDLKKC